MTKFKSAEFAAQMPSEGTVEGYAATFDREPDSYGDVIAKGAFARTLTEWSQKEQPIPLLYGHNTEDPEMNIGKVTEAYEDEKGLHVRAEFDADNPKAQYVRKLAKEGRLYQFSFAYSVRDAADVDVDGFKAYELRDLDLYEVSLVQIKSGRRNSKADADELRQIRALAAQITQAINGLLADEEGTDEPEGGPDPEANAEEPETVNAEEQKATDSDELERAKQQIAALNAAIEILTTL